MLTGTRFRMGRRMEIDWVMLYSDVCGHANSSVVSFCAAWFADAKKPTDFSAGFVVFLFLWRKGKRILAMSYFRMTFRHTIIGAAAFHGRVRNGNGWFHRAKITRVLSYA